MEQTMAATLFICSEGVKQYKVCYDVPDETELELEPADNAICSASRSALICSMVRTRRMRGADAKGFPLMATGMAGADMLPEATEATGVLEVRKGIVIGRGVMLVLREVVGTGGTFSFVISFVFALGCQWRHFLLLSVGMISR